MDDQKRIASVRTGDDFGDKTPDIKYFLDDHLGSSSVVLGATGIEINREEYYPFGETSFGSFSKKRYRFCGKEKDEESGLYYYGARYYAPWICRFVSVDALAHETPFFSPFAYADDNPVMNNDPTGNQSEKADGGGESGSKPIVHSVKEGETLSGIAKKYNSTIEQIAKDNGIKNIDLIKTGQNLSINSQHGDSNGNNDIVTRGAHGMGVHIGFTGVVSESVRAEYKAKVASLGPKDTEARTLAKIVAREKTPVVARVIAENMRPISGEKTRTGGTANKTNASVNKIAERLGTAGRITTGASLAYSTYKVATAENKPLAISEEGGAWAGAVVGGELGAKAGAALGLLFGGGGAIPGAVIGALVGSSGGAILGSKAGNIIYNNAGAVMKGGGALLEENARQGIYIYNEPKF